MAGQNTGGASEERERGARSAYDVKKVHRALAEWSDDELKQIPVLESGTRLRQGATCPWRILNSRAIRGCRDLARMCRAGSGRPRSAPPGDNRPTRGAWRRAFRGRRIRAHQAPTADAESVAAAFTQSPLL